MLFVGVTGGIYGIEATRRLGGKAFGELEGGYVTLLGWGWQFRRLFYH